MLGAHLRDRGRVIRKRNTGTRTEGGYDKKPEPGPWFRCFYDPGDESEVRTEGGVRRRRAAQVITGARALDGSAIELLATDVLEVQSRLHGDHRLDIVGDPEKLGNRRVARGWLARVGKTNRKAAG